MLNMTRVSLTLTPHREVEIQIDVDLSLLIGDSQGYRDLLLQPAATREPRLRQFGTQLLTELGLQLDARPLSLAPKSWTLPDAPPEKIGDQTTAAMTVFHYVEPLPPEAREMTLTPASLAKIEFPLAYTFSVPWKDLLMTRWLELPGATSRTLRLAEYFDEMAAVAAASGSPAGAAGGASPQPAVASSPAVPAPAAGKRPDAAEFSAFELQVARVVSTILQHLRLGFLHIFPQGADHIMFVLGLFFLGARWRPLLSQTTAFTIAHTTTLGLSAYGVISLPARIVEPLIALSITYVALEDIVQPKLRATRIAIVFGFGLVHGMGFANSLSEVPMPRDQFFTALFSFNLGVDAGQLVVLALAFLAVGWFRDRPWYRRRIVIPGCTAIAAIGAYWTVTRIFF